MTVSQGSQTIQRLCRLSGVSRAGYYRSWQNSAPRAHDTAVRDAIQRMALADSRRRGYRYITHQLRRDGIVVNHKRVLRLMRQDNLLCLRRKAFVPQTTDSRHDWEIVPNLVRGLRLTGLDQLWVRQHVVTELKANIAVEGHDKARSCARHMFNLPSEVGAQGAKHGRIAKDGRGKGFLETRAA